MKIKAIIYMSGFLIFNISLIIFSLSLMGCSKENQKNLLIEFVMEKETVVYGSPLNLAKDYKIVDSLDKEWLNSKIFLIESPGSSPVIKYLLAMNKNNKITDLRNKLELALNAIVVPEKCIEEMELQDFNELFTFYYLSLFDSVINILDMSDLPDSLNTYYSPPVFIKSQNTLSFAVTYMIKLNLHSQVGLRRDSMIVTNKRIKLYRTDFLEKPMILF